MSSKWLRRIDAWFRRFSADLGNATACLFAWVVAIEIFLWLLRHGWFGAYP